MDNIEKFIMTIGTLMFILLISIPIYLIIILNLENNRYEKFCEESGGDFKGIPICLKENGSGLIEKWEIIEYKGELKLIYQGYR